MFHMHVPRDVHARVGSLNSPGSIPQKPQSPPLASQIIPPPPGWLKRPKNQKISPTFALSNGHVLFQAAKIRHNLLLETRFCSPAMTLNSVAVNTLV